MSACGFLRASATIPSEKSTAATVARHLGITAVGARQHLNGLEKQGLIRRQPVDGDRRAKQIALTAAGQEQAAHVDKLVQEFRSDILKDISEDDLKAAIRVFHAMVRNIEAAS